MGNKLYVGNLSYGFRDDDLQQAFSEFGAVNSAKVMICLLYTSPSPRDKRQSRMPSSA